MSWLSHQPAELVNRRYDRQGVVAGIVLASVWHVGFDLSATLSSWAEYRFPRVSAAAWIIYSVLAAVAASGLLNKHGRSDPRHPRSLALTALALTIAVLVACPATSLLGPANWAWGSVGWLGVLILWRLPLRELATFVGLNALIMLTALIARGVVSRSSMAAFLMVIAGSVALQLGFSLGMRGLAVAGQQVTEQSARLASVQAGRAAADAVDAARGQRRQAVHEDTITLLEDLRSGSDPADPVVQHRCGVGAARIRRLITESQEGGQPLLDELRACADVASRKNVIVELESVGSIPAMPRVVRRAVTEPVIAALTYANSSARVTATALDREVIVSVVCDAPQLELPRTEPADASQHVDVSQYPEGGMQWIEIRWAHE